MAEFESMSDAELLRRSLSGEEEAFLVIYERLKQGIFRYALYMTNSQNTAEEVTQETFITLLARGSKFNPKHGDLGAFVFGLSRNIIRRVSRREHIYRSRLYDEPAEESQEIGAPEALTLNLIREQRVAWLRAAIAELPETYRQVVVLCDLCELSYADAAQRLECPIGTVRSRLHRAHALLAQALKLEGDAGEAVRGAGAEGCLT